MNECSVNEIDESHELDLRVAEVLSQLGPQHHLVFASFAMLFHLFQLIRNIALFALRTKFYK
jgi:hypothetical protein